MTMISTSDRSTDAPRAEARYIARTGEIRYERRGEIRDVDAQDHADVHGDAAEQRQPEDEARPGIEGAHAPTGPARHGVEATMFRDHDEVIVDEHRTQVGAAAEAEPGGPAHRIGARRKARGEH
jgi:hypothetical protein